MCQSSDSDYKQLDGLVRKLLATLFRSDRKSVEQFADILTAKLGRPITARTLREFTAKSKERIRFPLLLLPVLLEVADEGKELRRFALGPKGEKAYMLGQAVADIVSASAQRRLLARKKRRVKRGKR